LICRSGAAPVRAAPDAIEKVEAAVCARAALINP
jgi:hypothetical protein